MVITTGAQSAAAQEPNKQSRQTVWECSALDIIWMLQHFTLNWFSGFSGGGRGKPITQRLSECGSWLNSCVHASAHSHVPHSAETKSHTDALHVRQWLCPQVSGCTCSFWMYASCWHSVCRTLFLAKSHLFMCWSVCSLRLSPMLPETVRSFMAKSRVYWSTEAFTSTFDKLNLLVLPVCNRSVIFAGCL